MTTKCQCSPVNIAMLPGEHYMQLIGTLKNKKLLIAIPWTVLYANYNELRYRRRRRAAPSTGLRSAYACTIETITIEGASVS